MKVQMNNASLRGGFRGDHMQKPETRSKANKAISEASKTITSEYDLQGILIKNHLGLRSTITPELPVALWSAIENRDPFRIWVKENSSFEEELHKKLKLPNTFIELDNDNLISITTVKLRNMGRDFEGISSRKYRNLKNSEFISFEEYRKRSTTSA